MTAYYNEYDKYAAQWLRNLISQGLIAPGDVDERSITDVQPDDLLGYTQCHFFAGIGGWSLGARLAGWPDSRPLWTGSAPCQPFSVAGKQAGQADERHLWPTFAALIGARRPPVVMGEQVAAAVGKDWLDGVLTDLEGIGYTGGAAVVPACAVDAPHRRDRLWFVADAAHQRIDGSGNAGQGGRAEHSDGGSAGAVANAESSSGSVERNRNGSARQYERDVVGASRRDGKRYHPERDSAAPPRDAAEAGVLADTDEPRSQGRQVHAERRNQWSAWANSVGLRGADGKTRRFEPGIRLLAHGVPARVGKLRAYGNAIVPQVAAEVIGAYLDAEAQHLRLIEAPTVDIFS